MLNRHNNHFKLEVISVPNLPHPWFNYPRRVPFPVTYVLFYREIVRAHAFKPDLTQAIVDGTRNDVYSGERAAQVPYTPHACDEERNKYNLRLWYAVIEEHTYGHKRRGTGADLEFE